MSKNKLKQSVEHLVRDLKEIVTDLPEYRILVEEINDITTSGELKIFKNKNRLNLFKGNLIRMVKKNNLQSITINDIIIAGTNNEVVILDKLCKLDLRKRNIIKRVSDLDEIIIPKSVFEKIMNAISEDEIVELINPLPYSTKLILGFIPNSKKGSMKTKNSIRAIYTPMGNKTR